MMTDGTLEPTHGAHGKTRAADARSTAGRRPRWGTAVLRWFDSWHGVEEMDSDDRRLDLVRIVPFLLLHVCALAVIWVGWSWTALGVAVALYLARMFAITAFYHRYFSHRAFKTSRVMQFLGAALGASAVQRGPLWWAAHHRAHHRNSDRPEDTHSPRAHGFWWSHVGWFLAPANFRTRLELVRDLARFPELRWLDRFDVLVPAVSIVGIYGLGAGLERWAPGLGTNGAQLVVWGFLLSTLACYHVTFCINSVAHAWGQRRFSTGDHSRNSLPLALLTLGEGWHNNHHHYPGSTRQGFYWWEVDVAYYGLRVLAAFGLVWDLRPVPAEALERRRLR